MTKSSEHTPNATAAGLPYADNFAQGFVALLLLSTLFANSSNSSVAGRVAISDGLLVLMGAVVLLRVLRVQRTDFFKIYAGIFPPVLLMIILFLAFILITQDTVVLYLVNLFALMYLLVPGAMLSTPRSQQNMRVITLAMLVIIGLFALVSLLGGGSGNYRTSAAGSFTNPNHTSAFAALSLMVMAVGMKGYRGIRAGLTVLCLMVLAQTFSFGAVMALALGLVAGFWFRLEALTMRLALLLGALVAVVSLDRLVTLLGRWVPRLQGGTDQLDRSRETRFGLWEEAQAMFDENPFGRGLGHVDDAMRLDIHSDQLTFLAAFGLLGPITLFLIFAAIWRLGGPTSRAVAVFIIVESFTHDSLSWRYQWIFLAIAIAMEIAYKQTNEGAGSGVGDLASLPPPDTPAFRQVAAPRSAGGTG